ncbi:MAG: TlpA disulfide reductase family protein [Bacteroidota bacterium]
MAGGISVSGQSKSAPKPGKAALPVWHWKETESLLKNANDTVYVVNFWATWCRPCIQELPVFEASAKKYQNRPVRFVMISMDFLEELQTRLLPFISRRKMQLPVVLLHEPDQNKWISKVDQAWEGSLPATLVFNNAKNHRSFFGSEVRAEELEKEIEKGLR